jgi:hypothetical protein
MGSFLSIFLTPITKNAIAYSFIARDMAQRQAGESACGRRAGSSEATREQEAFARFWPLQCAY